MRSYGAEADGILCCQNTDTLGAHRQRLIVGKPVSDRLHLLFQVIHCRKNESAHVVIDVASRAADNVHRIVYAVAGQGFQRIHRLLTVFPDLHKKRVMTDDMTRNSNPQKMRMDALQLLGDHSDVLPSLRNFHLRNVLYAHRISQRMGMRTDSADTLHQHQCLNEVSFLSEFFDASVIIANKNLRIPDFLSFYDQSRMDRLFESGVIRPNRNDIAHIRNSPFEIVRKTHT